MSEKDKYLSDKEVSYQEFGSDDIKDYPPSMWNIWAIKTLLRKYFNRDKYRLTDNEIASIKSQKYPRKYYYYQQLFELFEILFGFCAALLGITLIIIFNDQLSAFINFKNLDNLLALGYPIVLFSSMALGGGFAIGIMWYFYSKLPDPLLRDYILRKNMTHSWYGSFKSYYLVGFRVGILGLMLCLIVFDIWLLASIFIGY